MPVLSVGFRIYLHLVHRLPVVVIVVTVVICTDVLEAESMCHSARPLMSSQIWSSTGSSAHGVAQRRLVTG